MLSAALVAVLLMPAGTASASCAGPPTPSPNRFVGVVTQLKDGGRLAVVRRDDGATVVVRAGPGGETSSEDRTFTEGTRYEFHPTNAASPYDDNACTATRSLGAAPAGTGTSGADSRTAKIALGITLVGAVLAAPVLARRLRRGFPGGTAPPAP